MKLLNGNRMKLVVLGIIAASLIGGNAKADLVIGDAVLMDEAINHPSSKGVQGGSLSHDGLKFYFSMERDGGYGSFDIWVCERESLYAPWGEAANLGPNINSRLSEEGPEISPDELELYFSSGERSGDWVFHTMRSIRASKDEPWGPPTEYTDLFPNDFSSDGLTMYFTDRWSLPGYGEGDIWMVTRASTDGDWGDPINLGPNVNNERRQGNACISNDDLALFFNEDDSLLMKMSVRGSRDADWGPAVDISATLCPEHQKRYNPELSPDGRSLYFHHHDWGAFTQRKFWQAPITPIVDLNSDGIVNAEDMCIVVDNWGTNNSLCDVGPMPWGDGVVDVQDLIVLAEHLFEDYRMLAAHWPLDEIEGMIAHDSVSGNNDFVMGVPIWQPTGGKVDGAIELNGVDNCIITSVSLNPSDGPFSVFVWVKGGAPGQVIISQQAVSDWLTLDSEGNLMTELESSDQLAGPLVSETVITDGQWHRIGLVWNDSTRKLYVDGFKVAEDKQPGLESSQNSLYIGVGKDYTAGTFFSGLIDDIRIYNRIVSP